MPNIDAFNESVVNVIFTILKTNLPCDKPGVDLLDFKMFNFSLFVIF